MFAKKFLGAAGLAATASLLFGSVMATNSFAAVGPCKSDPEVTLSDGVTVTLYENISDTATDVSKIVYTLEVPSGVTVKSVVYTGAVPATVQTISTTANENAGNYDAYTTVYTKSPNIPVTAYMSANGSVSTQTAGHSGQQQHCHLHVS